MTMLMVVLLILTDTVMNVGTTMLLNNTSLLPLLMLPKMLSLVTKVILYVPITLSMNPYLTMVLFVVLFTLLTKDLKLITVVSNLMIYLKWEKVEEDLFLWEAVLLVMVVLVYKVTPWMYKKISGKMNSLMEVV